nr:glycine-rich RNA-binding protein 1-like [Quercus suber]
MIPGFSATGRKYGLLADSSAIEELEIFCEDDYMSYFSFSTYHEVPRGEDQVNVALDDKIMFDEEGTNLLQAMRTVNFWLLFIAMGSTQAMLNNLSQIGQSLNYTIVEVNNFFSLWSIWNCLSRVGVGGLGGGGGGDALKGGKSGNGGKGGSRGNSNAGGGGGGVRGENGGNGGRGGGRVRGGGGGQGGVGCAMVMMVVNNVNRANVVKYLDFGGRGDSAEGRLL